MNWRGWAAIGAILMMVAGVFQIISGIYGLFNDEWVVLGYDGYFLVDVTGLAVWTLIIGVVLLLGGLAVVQGSTLGRIVGVVAASLAIISQLFMLPVHPVWSIVLIVLYVMALIGFVVVKEPVETNEQQVAKAAEEKAAAAEVPQAAPPVGE
jgi:predicted membrane protein